ncbi:DUF4174 domain-containing protein [Primorskyibacter sp. 2E107]|uniref:DUF4174 domain-containing protein n=1 Tax=Primorskyibacter sp. 2E107 TaxID=3403458 RepID=UPI003AF4F8BB
MPHMPKPFTRALALLSGIMVSPALAADLIRPLPSDRANLDDLRWQARPVLIFAPSGTDEDFRRQMRLFDAVRAGLAERDIVVFADTAPKAGGLLRQRFGIEGFQVLLVGKDGGVKLSQSSPLAPDTLFATIDAMPMRRQEMQE